MEFGLGENEKRENDLSDYSPSYGKTKGSRRQSWVRCEQILGKHSQVERGAQASHGRLHVTRGWVSAATENLS